MTAREFVADDLWMVVAVMTLGTIMVLGILGLEMASSLTVAVGWFILTPLFLFWGEEIAEVFYGKERSQGQSAETDALTELKQRYARGEIDDAEFEQRLERLIELDEIPAEARRVTEPSNQHGSSSDAGVSPDRDKKRSETETARNRELDS